MRKLLPESAAARKNSDASGRRVRLLLPGQRIIKTAIAVLICLLIGYGRGYRAGSMSSEAAMTAIICMQPYLSTSAEYAVSRFAGSLIGSFWGLMLLFFLLAFPAAGTNYLILYTAMAAGILLCLYSSVLLKMPDTSSLAAIVYLSIVIAFPEVENPIWNTVGRMTDIMIGTAVAILVNTFRLPRDRNENQVFFVNVEDIAHSLDAKLSPAASFRFHQLCRDGALICMVSEHAPAFFSLQMDTSVLKVPMIVMDGAAIYDANTNQYLWSERINPLVAADIRNNLEAAGISYFIYTIHRNRICIFHSGSMRSEEKIIMERMQRSPYRSYLDGEIYEDNEIVYLKILVKEARLEMIRKTLTQDLLPEKNIRMEVRRQDGAEDVFSIYIYSRFATIERAKKALMEIMRRENALLQPQEITITDGYRDDRDAMLVLKAIEKLYEPVSLFGHKTS